MKNAKIWIGLALAISIVIGFLWYGNVQLKKELKVVKQELKASIDSSYAKIENLDSLNKNLKGHLLIVQELLLNLKPETTIAHIDTIIKNEDSVNVKFSGENYLFNYFGETTYFPKLGTGQHHFAFKPYPIELTSSLYRDSEDNWFHEVKSKDERIGISSRLKIDKNLILSEKPQAIKPKSFTLYPYVYLKRDWDNTRYYFDAGLQLTYYSVFLNTSARELGLGIVLKKLKF